VNTRNTGTNKRAFLICTIEEKLSKFKTFDEKVALIDAFLQFSQNPTSATAGFAIEENIERIKGNLEKRFKISQKAIENIVNILRHFATKARGIDPDFYSWFSEIKRYLEEAYLKDLLAWREKLYEGLDHKRKEYFMFLLHALLKKDKYLQTIDWFKEYFDPNMSSIEIESMLIEYGLADLLFFRHSHHKYEMEELRPFAFLQELSSLETFKNPLTEKDVEALLFQLTILELKYLEKALKKTGHPTIYFGGEGISGLLVKLENKIMYSINKRRNKLSLSPFIIDMLEHKIVKLKKEMTKSITEKLIRVLNNLVLRSQGITMGAITWQYVFDYEGAHGFLVKYSLDPRELPLEVGVAIIPYVFYISHQETISHYIEEKLRTPYKIVFVEKEPIITLIRDLSGLRGITTVFLKEKDGYVLMQIGTTTWLRSPHKEWYSILLGKFLDELKKQGIRVLTKPQLPELVLKYPRLAETQLRFSFLEAELREAIRSKMRNKHGENWINVLSKKLPQDTLKMMKARFERKRKRSKGEVKDILDGADLADLCRIIEILLKDKEEGVEILKEKKDLDLLKILKKYRDDIVHLAKKPEKDLNEKTYEMLIKSIEHIVSKITK